MLINLRNALMAGKRKPTAKDYVQSGLVAMWDGIENAGWGVHDPSATKWTELVSGIAVNLANANATYGWGDDCLIVSAETSSTNGYIMNFANSALNLQLNEALAYTVEVVAVKTDDNVSSSDQWLSSSASNPFLLQSYRTNTRIDFFTNNNSSSILVSANVRIPFTASVSQVKSGGKTVYLNGTYKNSDNTETNPTFASIRITNRGGAKKRFNIRIYSRALTASEIAANYAIDKERFNLP